MALFCSITYTCQVLWDSFQNLFLGGGNGAGYFQLNCHYWSDSRLFYLFMVIQQLISKPRNMWLHPRRPRLDIKSSCRPLSNLQNISPTPAACSTPPPAARRPPHLKVRRTQCYPQPLSLNLNLGFPVLKLYSFPHRRVHPYVINTNRLSVHLFCSRGVFMCVFFLWPVS